MVAVPVRINMQSITLGYRARGLVASIALFTTFLLSNSDVQANTANMLIDDFSDLSLKSKLGSTWQEVSDRVMVSEGHLEWRPILCETNTSADVVRKLQMALRDAGHNPGPIDGRIGQETMAAVNAYQKTNGLASGQLTMETLRKLKVI